MKRLYPLLFISVLIYWGCDDPKEEDTEKPTVSISYPLNNSTVSEMVVRRQNLLDTFAFELREYFDVSFCYSFYAN